MTDRTDGRTTRRQPFSAVLRERALSHLWLARQIDFSHSHVRNVAAGQFPASARFRAACARALDLPEGVLFHDGSSASRPEGTPTNGSDDGAGIAVARAYPREQEVSVSNLA